MLGKRMHNGSKTGVFGRSSGKGKDIISKTIASRYSKNQLLDSSDVDNSNNSFPYIKPAENAELLPCYYSVLNRPLEEGIGMKDLDQLQLELEKLLSASAIRSRLLTAELESLDRAEDRHDKKGKFFEKPPSPKHRKLEEKVKLTRESKPAFNKQVKTFQEEAPKLEVPKLTLPKNDTKSKFWLSVDAYCAPVSTDDKTYLDELVEEINSEIDVKFGDVGPHYVGDWNLETPQNPNILARAGKSKGNLGNVNGFFTKKHGYFSGETYPNSIILPLASALLEENVNKKGSTQDKSKDSGVKTIGPTCLDKRLRSELAELGLIDIEDNQKVKSKQDDEIIREIKLCQNELYKVNECNIKELNRLRHAVNKDLARQEFVNKLASIDNKVMEIYNKIVPSTSKERTVLEWEAVKIIQMQKQVHKEALEINDTLT